MPADEARGGRRATESERALVSTTCTPRASSCPQELGYTCDISSWEQRGWCRLERQAFTISNYTTFSPPPLYIVQGKGQFQRKGSEQITHRARSVFNGEFTVESDRLRLFPVLRRIFEFGRIARQEAGDWSAAAAPSPTRGRARRSPPSSALTAPDLGHPHPQRFEYALAFALIIFDLSGAGAFRKLTAMEHVFFSGCVEWVEPWSRGQPLSLESFLAKYHFDSVHDHGTAHTKANCHTRP